jgi:hypothetical protein
MTVESYGETLDQLREEVKENLETFNTKSLVNFVLDEKKLTRIVCAPGNQEK